MYMNICRVYAGLGLFLFILSFITMAIAQCQIRKLKRERHRLDRALNRYNRAFNDDYDYFNGYDA